MNYKEMHSFHTCTIVLKILVLKQVMKKGIVDPSRDCFENGDNFSIFKREF